MTKSIHDRALKLVREMSEVEEGISYTDDQLRELESKLDYILAIVDDEFKDPEWIISSVKTELLDVKEFVAEIKEDLY